MFINFQFLAVFIWLFFYGFTENGIETNIITASFSILYFINKSVLKSIQRKRTKNEDFNEEQLKNIEKVMREPKCISISNFEERIRRNLLFTSMLTTSFTILGLNINEESKFFGGLQFNNLDDESIYIVLLVVILYEFFHYFWIQFNNFSEWRIRLTGITLPKTRGDERGSLSSDNNPFDYSGTDQNSNLYNWMFEKTNERSAAMTTLLSNQKSLSNLINDLNNNSANNINNQLKTLNNSVSSMNTTTEQLIKSLENIRINGSLLRFDQWFKILIKSQNTQWLILDICLPLITSCFALFFLISKLSE